MNTSIERELTVRPEEAETDGQWFVLNHAQLARFAEAIVSAVGGDKCEVVVHDFRSPARSISHISGKVTGRRLGGSMSQIGVAMMSERDSAQDRIDYLAHTTDGKRLRSTTVALRDRDGHVVGALCINRDISGGPATTQPEGTPALRNGAHRIRNVHFGNDISELVHVMILETVEQLGLSEPPVDPEQRQAFVRALNDRGFFVVRSAIPILAEFMGVSRGLIYHYLKDPSDHPTKTAQERMT